MENTIKNPYQKESLEKQTATWNSLGRQSNGPYVDVPYNEESATMLDNIEFRLGNNNHDLIKIESQLSDILMKISGKPGPGKENVDSTPDGSLARIDKKLVDAEFQIGSIYKLIDDLKKLL
jgi:hypothetical protein